MISPSSSLPIGKEHDQVGAFGLGVGHGAAAGLRVLPAQIQLQGDFLGKESQTQHTSIPVFQEQEAKVQNHRHLAPKIVFASVDPYSNLCRSQRL